MQVSLLGSAAQKFLARPNYLYVDGKFSPAADGKVFSTLDPSTAEPFGEVAFAGVADVDRAVTAARRAFESSWGGLAAAGRTRLLNRLADLIEEHAEELAQLEALDGGKPISVASTFDIPATIDHFRYFGGWPSKIEGNTIPTAIPDMLCYTHKEPVGICAQIIPWNFPLLMAAYKLGAPLAAGCTVVLKPAEQTPLTALRLAELIDEAGFPAGVINVLTGDGTTGAQLVDHPGVDKIAFTGSTVVGREIAAKAGHTLKRVTLELGGKSPNIILPDADPHAAAVGAFQAIYFNTGQGCIAGSRLFVHRSLYDQTVDSLVDAAARARVGAALDPATELGPMVSAEQYHRVRGYIDNGIKAGAELRVGECPEPEPEAGYFIRPSLFTEVPASSPLSVEEIFGPVLVVSAFDELDEVVDRANDTEYGLAAGVWTRDVSAAHTVAARLRAGMVYLNCWGLSDPAAPFGGVKSSGIGRELGHTGLDGYLESKTVWTNLAR